MDILFLSIVRWIRRAGTAAVCICAAMSTAAAQSRPLASPIVASQVAASQVVASTDVYRSVHEDLRHGRANDAIFLLRKRLALNSSDAPAHQLLCRVFLQEQRWPDAEQQCEQAVSLDPANSEDHLWLGRAYGGEAAHASLARAYALARKVRAEFETAVRLDARNVAALSDLGEYYVDVPRLLGGGPGRAETIARLLAPLNTTRFHELQAKIDAKKSDFSGAEKEWKLAIQSTPHPAQQWMELAGYYAGQKNFPAMQESVEHGIAADPADGCALVDGAELMIENRRDLPRAEQLLRQYLASSRQSEEAPAFQIHALLGDLLALRGDKPAAEQQYAAAHALASNFIPAQETPRG